MNEDVSVKFGGTTAGLDTASKKAVKDVEAVGKAAGGLQGVFSKVKDGFGSMFANSSNVEKGKTALGGIGKEAGIARLAMGALMPVIAGVGAALAAAFSAGALMNFARNMSGLAEQLDKTAQKLGMTTTEVSRWNAVAAMTDMSAEQLNSGFTRLERSMVLGANGGKQQIAVFKEMGIELKSLKSPTEAVFKMADKFKGMEDGPKKVALAMGMMGRSGADMIPILNQGSEALKKMMGDAEAMGAVMSEELVAAGLAVDDSIDRMDLGFQGLRNTLFEALAPTMAVVIDQFGQMIRGMIESYRSGGVMRTVLDSIVVGLKVVISAIGAMVASLRILWSVGQVALKAVLGTLGTVGMVIVKLFQGDFTGAVATFRTGMKVTGNAVVGDFNRMTKAGQDHAAFQKSLWKGGLPKGKGASVGSSMDMDIPGLGPGGGGGSKKKDNSAAEARRAAEERMRVYLDELDYKKDLARDDYAEQLRLQDEKLRAIKEFYGEESQEYIRAMRDRSRMERDHRQEIIGIERDAIDQKRQIRELGLEADREIAETRLDDERAHLEDMVSLGKMSEVEKTAALRQILVQQFQLEASHEAAVLQLKTSSLRAELALQDLRPSERRRILAQIEEIEAAHLQKMRTLEARNNAAINRANADQVQATVTKWKGITEPIAQGFNTMFSSLYTRSQTFGQAMLSLADGMVMHWAQKGFEWVANWAAMELAKTAATQTGTAVRTAADATAAATGAATSATAGMAQITTNAAVGASGAFAATAPIPFIGPGLAPAAAAVALAAILGFGGMIASARGGYDIPAGTNPMTQLHEKEMVLPAHIAEPLRQGLRSVSPRTSGLGPMSMAAGRQTRSEGALRAGDTNFHYKPQHNHQNADLATLLRKDGSSLRKWLRNEARNGAFGSDR